MHTNSVRAQKWGVAALMVALFSLSLGRVVYMNYQAGMRSWDLTSSAFLLAVPIALLFFSIGIFVLAWLQRRGPGQISSGLAKAIYYTPRIAGILMLLFVGMFSLDVFGAGLGFWETVGAFFIHNIATILLGIVLALAWRRPVIGFVAFLLGAIFFLRFVLGGAGLNLGHILLFSGPLGVIALLFWANWKWPLGLAKGDQRGKQKVGA